MDNGYCPFCAGNVKLQREGGSTGTTTFYCPKCYFGETRFSARLIFAMSLWRYAEEIKAQESGA